MAPGDGLFSAARFNRRRHGGAGVRDPDDIHATANNDAFAFKPIDDDRRAFGIILGERLRDLENRHRASETAKGLRHFEADWTRADDNEMLWSLLQIEDILVGEIRAAVEPGNRRHGRPRSGRDHETPCANFGFSGNDSLSVLEPGARADHPNAERGEPRG